MKLVYVPKESNWRLCPLHCSDFLCCCTSSSRIQILQDDSFQCRNPLGGPIPLPSQSPLEDPVKAQRLRSRRVASWGQRCMAGSAARAPLLLLVLTGSLEVTDLSLLLTYEVVTVVSICFIELWQGWNEEQVFSDGARHREGFQWRLAVPGPELNGRLTPVCVLLFLPLTLTGGSTIVVWSHLLCPWGQPVYHWYILEFSACGLAGDFCFFKFSIDGTPPY